MHKNLKYCLFEHAIFPLELLAVTCWYSNFMSHQAFHCSEPASLQVSCLPLFLSFLAYEVYYHTEPAEGAAVTQVLLNHSLWRAQSVLCRTAAPDTLSHNAMHIWLDLPFPVWNHEPEVTSTRLDWITDRFTHKINIIFRLN